MLDTLRRKDPIIAKDVEELIGLKEKVPFEGKKVLITGVAGFLGSWMADALYALGAEIIGIDNLSTSSLENIEHLLNLPHFKLLKNDLINYEWNGAKYDFILHLAARPSPDDYIKYPIETLLISSMGTHNVLEIARKCDAILLYTSTSEVYGDPKAIPTPESYWGYVNPIGPRSCYDEGKRFAEALCMAYLRQYGVDVRISRIFNTYGPRLDWSMLGYGRVVVRFILAALNNKPITIYGDGLQTRSFCYVSDCIEAQLLLASSPKAKGEVVNVGSDHEITILELAKLIKELTGSKSEITFEPPRPDDPKRRRPDIRKAKELLNWSPRTKLEDGLPKTIDWIRSKVGR